MHRKKSLPIVLIISVVFVTLFSSISRAKEKQGPSKISIDTTKTGEPISKYVYGQFIEHLGRCIYGGIWAEMLEDRKFYYPVTEDFAPYSEESKTGGQFPVITGSPWEIIGNSGSVKMITENSYVGQQTPMIITNGKTPVGIQQGRIALEKGKAYTGRIILAGSQDAGAVKVSLIWGEQKNQRDTVTIDVIDKKFRKYPLRFQAGDNSENGKLQIVGYGKGEFMIGTVSLMPADNINGMRADTLDLLKKLNAPLYRWPGGNFVSGYDWRDGIGDVDKRPTRKNPAWSGLEYNDFGLDEFIAFCREVKAEPMIAVNTGFGDAHSAYEEVMYVNDSAGTLMGNRRAKNGHQEPYDVKFWCVGNEMFGEWQLGYMSLAHYTLKHNRVAEKMYKADPSIKLVGVGDAGEWSKGMLEECAESMDLISEHWYVGFEYSDEEMPSVQEHVNKPVRVTRNKAEFHRKMRQELESLKGKDIRIALDEWNYWYGPHVYGELGVRYHLQDALGIAAGLHEMFRNSDLFYMANYAQTVNVIGCIKTTKTEAGFATTAMPLMLYRNHFGELPVKVTGTPEPLDIAAALTEDRDGLTIGVVNPSNSKMELKLNVLDATPANTVEKWEITASDPMTYNEPGKKPQVKIKKKSVRITDNQLQISPLSVTVYKLQLK